MTMSEVLVRYAIADGATVIPLGNHGGFSGARLWRVSGPMGECCLRAWPLGTDPLWLAETHRLIDQACAAGLPFVPRIERTRAGQSFVPLQDHLWEVASWLPGTADFHRRPAPGRLANAMTALATLHEVWRTAPRAGRCPAILRRLATARRWLERVASGWQPRFTDEHHPAMNLWAERAWPILREHVPLVSARLRPWQTANVPLQPCLCDIWHDHVLFTGDVVTGIVDYGSVHVDHVAVDLARLIGSMAGDDELLRAAALDAYRERCKLSADEIALIEVLDETGTLLGAANWLMWVYHDGRVFADMEKAALRLAALVQRLRD